MLRMAFTLCLGCNLPVPPPVMTATRPWTPKRLAAEIDDILDVGMACFTADRIFKFFVPIKGYDHRFISFYRG